MEYDMKVAFVGLGVMGYPMAGHLQKAGHDVTVFNRTSARAAAWVDTYTGTHAATPKEAAQGAEMVFVCVGNDDDACDRDVIDDSTKNITASNALIFFLSFLNGGIHCTPPAN